MAADRNEAVISLAKRRGVVYPCGEIYGGTRSAWDYGPLGIELKDNVKNAWWREMVQTRDDIVGLDSSVILPSKVWEASGHLDAFVDQVAVHVRMTQIEADADGTSLEADVVFHEVHQRSGAGQLVRDHFNRDLNAQRFGDSMQFLDAAPRRRAPVGRQSLCRRPR